MQNITDFLSLKAPEKEYRPINKCNKHSQTVFKHVDASFPLDAFAAFRDPLPDPKIDAAPIQIPAVQIMLSLMSLHKSKHHVTVNKSLGDMFNSNNLKPTN